MSKKPVDETLESEAFPAPPEELPVGVQSAEVVAAPEIGRASCRERVSTIV